MKEDGRKGKGNGETGRGYENVDCRRSSPEFCTDSQIKGTAWPHAPTARILFLRNKSRGWFLPFSHNPRPRSLSLQRYVRCVKERGKRIRKREKTNRKRRNLFRDRTCVEVREMTQSARPDRHRPCIDIGATHTRVLLEKETRKHALAHIATRIDHRWIDPQAVLHEIDT